MLPATERAWLRRTMAGLSLAAAASLVLWLASLFWHIAVFVAVPWTHQQDVIFSTYCGTFQLILDPGPRSTVFSYVVRPAPYGSLPDAFRVIGQALTRFSVDFQPISPGLPDRIWLTFPGWVFVLAFGAGPLIWIAKRWRQRPTGAGICGQCGYDLRGVTSGTCPECGAAVELSEG